jgi:hypothetical protein
MMKKQRRLGVAHQLGDFTRKLAVGNADAVDGSAHNLDGHDWLRVFVLANKINSGWIVSN